MIDIMRKFFIALMVFSLLFACSFSPSKINQTNHQTDSISTMVETIDSLDEKITNSLKLPFDFHDYQIWQDKYDMGEIDERLYSPAYFEDSPLLTKCYFKKWNSGDTIPCLYYDFVIGSMNIFTLQCIGCRTKNTESSFYQIATKNSNGYIDGIICFKYVEGHDWNEQSYTISKDLEIVLYHNKLNDDGSIAEQDVTAKYKINKEGKFIRVGQYE